MVKYLKIILLVFVCNNIYSQIPYRKFYDVSNFNLLGFRTSYIRTFDGGNVVVLPIDKKVSSRGNFCLLKTDAVGSIDWAFDYKTLDSTDEIKTIIQLPDSSFGLVGINHDFMGIAYDASSFSYFHIDKNGLLLSAKRINNTFSLILNSGCLEYTRIAEHNASLLMTYQTPATHHKGLLELDYSGNILSSSFYHLPNPNDQFHFGPILSLSTTGSIVFCVTTNSVILLRLDNAKNIMWVKNLAGINDISDVIKTSTNDFLLLGGMNSIAQRLLVKINSSGDVVWSKRMSHNIGANFVLQTVNELPDGNYVATNDEAVGGMLAVIDTAGNLIGEKGFYPQIPFTVLTNRSNNNFGNSMGIFSTSLYNGMPYQGIIVMDSLLTTTCNNFITSNYSLIDFIITQSSLNIISQANDTCVSFDVLNDYITVPSVVNVLDECVLLPITNIDNNSFEIFPNPVRSSLFIETKAVQNFDVIIYDVTGKLVYKFTSAKNDLEIDLSFLQCGIYIAELKSGTSNLLRKKFSKL